MLTEEDLEDLGGSDQPFLDRPAHSSASADLPSVGQVYEGVVVKTQPFGAFVEIPGFKQHGLVHISQLSEMKVDEVEDVVSKGQRVFVKVLEIKRVDGKERISLSMKYCSQSDGRDKDVNGVKADLEMRKHRPRGQDPRSIELGAIYNSRCTKCGGQGHLAFECYNTSGQKYELVEDEEPSAPRMGAAPPGRMGAAPPGRMGRGQAQDNTPRMQVGRGRGATLPAWMTQGGGAGAGAGANGARRRDRSHSAGRYSDASVDSRDSRRRRRSSRSRSRSRSKGRRRDRRDSRGRDRHRDRSRSRSRDRRRETSAERRERKEAKKRRKEEKKRRKHEKKEKKAKKEKKHKKEKERKHESRSDRRRGSPNRSVSRGRSVSSRSSSSSRSGSSRRRSRSR